MNVDFRVNDRVDLYAGSADQIRADVLKVSKKGDRLFVSHWGRGMMEGKLVKTWVYSKGVTLVRRAA